MTYTYEDVQDVQDGGYVPDYDGQPVEGCPACGEAPDYCQGHGPVGDPVGHALLVAEGYYGDDYEDEGGEEADESEEDEVCAGCGLPICLTGEGGYWFVYGTKTSADGLTYCPPNPDHDEEHDGPVGHHQPGGAS